MPKRPGAASRSVCSGGIPEQKPAEFSFMPQGAAWGGSFVLGPKRFEENSSEARRGTFLAEDTEIRPERF